MNTSRKNRASDFALAFLAVASGSSDAMSFIVFGSVFTSAMTGNTALIGIATGKGHLLAATLPLLALFGFVGGAAIATALCGARGVDLRLVRVLRTLLLVEIGVLGVFLAVWSVGGFPIERPAVYGLVLLSASAMGIQGVAARRIGEAGINTIVVTSTLIGIVMSVTENLLGRSETPAPKPTAPRQFAVFVAYGIGSTLAGLVAWRARELVPWLPLGAVMFSLACCELAFEHDQSAPEPH